MTAYYNEFDKNVAEWIRNLINAGLIAPGIVDERSIEDVRPDDLDGFTQCHFFAGLGGWSYALRLAGWSDHRSVWTASCPCQPYSAAGQGGGFADERHLWPHFEHLLREQKRRPAIVFGEQVASKFAEPWVDLVHADLEALGYAFGCVPFPSASVGAPHIRDRLYWMADAESFGARGQLRNVLSKTGEMQGATPGQGDGDATRADSAAMRMGHANDPRLERLGQGHQAPRGWDGALRPIAPPSQFGRLADAILQQRSDGQPGLGDEHEARRRLEGTAAAAGLRSDRGMGDAGRPGPTNGFWRDADWLFCRDGKWRPVEASAQPLVDGSAESLGRVRPEIIAQVEEEINATTAQAEGGRTAAMRALLETLGAEAKCCWPAGGVPGLHAAPFLLAFLRQLQAQGWNIAEGVALSRTEATSGVLRSVWHDQAVAGASHRRGLEEQRSGEPTDVVCVLSRILARHASEAWGSAYAAYAEIGFPLGHNSPARMGRLRAYGNAINVEQARIFIQSAMSVIDLPNSY